MLYNIELTVDQKVFFVNIPTKDSRVEKPLKDLALHNLHVSRKLFYVVFQHS